MSSYYKVSHILFIYLVGRSCIPGIFGWFVLLCFFVFFFFFGLCNIFSFLKRPDHPVGGSPPPRRQTSPRSTLPELSLLWAPSNSVQNRELVSVGQDISGKPGSLLQRAQITLRQRQNNYSRGWFAEWITQGCGGIPWVHNEGKFLPFPSCRGCFWNMYWTCVFNQALSHVTPRLRGRGHIIISLV